MYLRDLSRAASKQDKTESNSNLPILNIQCYEFTDYTDQIFFLLRDGGLTYTYISKLIAVLQGGTIFKKEIPERRNCQPYHRVSHILYKPFYNQIYATIV